MEKTIFDYINAVLFTKKKQEINTEDNIYNLYMLTRWISMYSPELCYYANETINKHTYKLFDNKQDQFDYILNILPKCPYKKISYIKKISKNTKAEKKDNVNKYIKDYAKNYEISEREIEMYLSATK